MKSKIPQLLVVWVWGAATICPVAQAQSKNDFFEKNYAESPLKENDSQRIPLEKENKVNGASASSESPHFSGMEITSLGGVINAQELRESQQALQHLLQLGLLKKIPFTDIYAFGTPQEVAQVSAFLNDPVKQYPSISVEESAVRSALLSALKAVASVPKEIPVQRAPAWIIGTSKGRYLLDGVESLSSYVSDEGEFFPKGSWEGTTNSSGFDSEKSLHSDSF